MELFQVLEKHDINQSSTIDRSELSAALDDVRKYFFKLNRVLTISVQDMERKIYDFIQITYCNK